MAEAGARITRVYGGFRGVDFRGEDINLVRSPDACNVWRDYREIESIRTRPGLRLQTDYDTAVRGIYFYNDERIVHAGTKLYRLKNGAEDVIFSACADAPSDSFIYENVWYFKDGKNYLPHTLNNTVVAPPRMLIAFLENNLQYVDGKYSVRIPEALRPYMGGKELIEEK